jgi:type IV pilus assembly protein PilP
MRRSLTLIGSAMLAWCWLGACGTGATTKPSPQASAERKVSAVDAGGADAAAQSELPIRQINEAELTESDKSRDPFRSYAQVFIDEVKKAVHSQREVVLDQFSLDELKLIGIVHSGKESLAMLVDPAGKGHTVQRGQFVGRAEVVQGAGQGAAYEINWRVDRIRDGDIVLIREDPRHPDVPTATKLIALRPEGTVTE